MVHHQIWFGRACEVHGPMVFVKGQKQAFKHGSGRSKRSGALRKDHTYAKRQKVHAESEGIEPGADISDASHCTNDAYSCEGSQATGTPVGLPVPVLSQRSKRIAIAYYYIHVLKAPGPQCWQGRNGTIAQIRKNLHIPEGSSVIRKFHQCSS